MQNTCDITLLLDDSGSMASIRAATIEGINAFIRAQQLVSLPPAFFTLAKFSIPTAPLLTIEFDATPIAFVPMLTDLSYNPCGCSTALNDAMGTLIKLTGARLAAIPEASRPNRVVFVTMTDGEENASREYTQQAVAQMIKHQQQQYAWTFIYLGADQDAKAVAHMNAIPTSNAATYDKTRAGVLQGLCSASNAVSDYRYGTGTGELK